jgi:phage terminase small subunit
MPRQKKLPYLEYLDGNPTKRPIEPFGIEAQGQPFIPEHLTDTARGTLECIRLSMPYKVYSALDSYLLSCFAVAWCIHVQAATAMAAPDFKVISRRGTINRWLVVAEKTTTQLLALSDRLGLDPRSRQALKLPHARQQQSKFADLIGRAQNPITTQS